MIGALRRLYARQARRARYRACLRQPLPLVVLRYHSVAEAPAAGEYVHPALSISPARFREQVRLLTRRFRIVSPDEVPELLSGGRGDRPPTRPGHSPVGRPAALLTFDDGYRDNYENAVPILVEEGAAAVFFITTGPLSSGHGLWVSELRRLVPRLPPGRWAAPRERGAADDRLFTVPANPARRAGFERELIVWLSALPSGERGVALAVLAAHAGAARGEGLEHSFVTPDQLREMAGAGMAIGAHTRSHPHLDRLAPEHMPEEVAGARRELEAILGRPVEHFAYPNPGGGGCFGGAGREAAAAAGFRTAYTSIAAHVDEKTDLLGIPRIGVNRGDAERALFACLARLPERA